MKIFDYNKIVQNANKLIENKSSKRMIYESLKLLVFNKKSILRKILFIFFEMVISIIIAKNLETVRLVKEIVSYIGQIQLGLIGIVFTGYALFQALIGDKLMLYLLSSEKDEKSKLEESNESFIYLIIIQIIALLLDLLMYIIMLVVPDNWYFTNNDELNVCVAAVFIAFMLYLNVEAIWELKSFIFNVYQLFNAHAVSRVVDIIEREKMK